MNLRLNLPIIITCFIAFASFILTALFKAQNENILTLSKEIDALEQEVNGVKHYSNNLKKISIQIEKEIDKLPNTVSYKRNIQTSYSQLQKEINALPKAITEGEILSIKKDITALERRQFKNETHQPRGLTKKGSSGIV
jgi:predicted RNase H-like nuclease (RuvC/YqgF family)